MSKQNLVSQWATWGPELQSVLRIVAAFMFIISGSPKLFGIPTPLPEGIVVPIMSQMWIGGVLEVFGGLLILLGLFTRPTAFILSGMMAVAYWQFHAPHGFWLWPTANGGAAAVLYCFVWLYFSAVGAGPWSLDTKRRRP